LKTAALLIGAALLIWLLIAWRFLGTDSDRLDKKLVHTRIRSFPVEVHTLGTLDAMHSHTVSSSIRGDEVKIIYLVDDGTHVKKSDTLIKFDSTRFEEKVQSLKGEVGGLSAAVKASEQMLEWEKNNVEGEIKNGQYQLKIARLNLKKLVEGDAPHEIVQREEAVNSAKEDMAQYISYLEELDALKQQGYEYPAETALARKKLAELRGNYRSAEEKLVTYRDHVFPLLKEIAKAKVEKAKQDLIQIQKLGTSRIAQAMADLEAAQAKLASAEKALDKASADLSKTTIKAPFDGIAILYETYRSGEKRKPRVGDLAIQNQPLLYLPDISQMLVKTRVREINLHKIALDQTAIISVEAYPKTKYTGHVNFIGALATNLPEYKAGEKYFGVTVRLSNGDMRLRPGMTARVSIQADHVADALTLPVQAVFTAPDHTYCYLYKGGWFKKTAIQTGRHNADYIEVVSGLDENDAVSLVKPDPAQILSIDS
jgi:HlyD family secretion protein